MVDTEALISLELIFVSADCPTNDEKKEHLQIANIQFNNLDIIGISYIENLTYGKSFAEVVLIGGY